MCWIFKLPAISRLIVMAVSLSISGVALAQDTTPWEPAQPSGQGVHMTHIPKTNVTVMGTMSNLHAIAATVTHVDRGTGVVQVVAGGMRLTVYFPPSTMQGLHHGDHITLAMGFTP
jgi:hypothetical protein